jgi:peptidyl-prolyl cis-trans isomerase C
MALSSTDISTPGRVLGQDALGKDARAPARSPTFLRGFVAKWLREPLVHFLAIGLVLFAAGEWFRQANDPYHIVVSPERVEKIASDYRLQFGELPSRALLSSLVDQYVNDEIYYRQGVALKLERNDEIVRRRIVQKMEFLQQNLYAPAEPTGAQLQAFYKSHASRYVTPDRLAFTHIYFSPDKGGDDAAHKRALAVLATLNDSVIRAPERGDPYSDLYDYASFGPDQAARMFGQTELSTKLFLAPLRHWSGPYRSGYGWHLVYVQSRDAAHLPPLASIRDKVRLDYLDEQQVHNNVAAFAALKRQFTIDRAYSLGTP